MIEKAEIIYQPSSGEFNEKIYDIESAWNSQNWSWIKFTNDDYTEWCGEFRGTPQKVAISKIYKIVLVLTSDYLFQLNINSGDIIAYESQPEYLDLITTPNGSILLSCYYNIYKVTKSIQNIEEIQSPIKMDMIKFKDWKGSKLEFTCDEFLNWDRHLLMQYNSDNDEIIILE